jgi:hypothetical protein
MIVIGLSSFALAQNKSIGFHVIDYDHFTQLDLQGQRDYIVLIMRTVSEMEAEIYFKKLKKDNSKEVQKKKRTVELIKKFLHQLTMPLAFAENNEKKDCLVAGWFSSYNTTTKSCSLPGVSNTQYQEFKKACGTKSPCNPAIFGLDSNNRPLCFEENKVKLINASLSCLSLFELAPNPNERIDQMIERLKRPENIAGRNAFNKTIQTIINACVCAENAPDNGHNVQLTQEYFDYMQGHRTCYSLIAQTQVLAEAFKQKNFTNSCLVLNKDNLDALANDLKVVSTHWAARRKDVFNNSDIVSVLSSPIYSIEEKNKLPPIALQPDGKNLDKVAEIDNCIRRIQTGDTKIECKLAGESLIADRHCPLELPRREEENTVAMSACEIDEASAEIKEGKLHIIASATPIPAGAKKTALTWKVGEVTQESLVFDLPKDVDLTKYSVAEVELTAFYATDSEETKISCSNKFPLSPSEEEASATAETPKETGSCTITPIMALNDKGQSIIEVSLTTVEKDSDPVGNVAFTGFSFVNSKPKLASVVITKTAQVQKKVIKASFKNAAGREFKCEVGVEIPASAQQTPAGGPQMSPQLPPPMAVPDIFLQGIN